MTRITSEDRTAATAYAMGERAAEARLAGAAAPAAELDMERLIRAMELARPFVDFGSPKQYGPRVAAEYALLATPEGEQP